MNMAPFEMSYDGHRPSEELTTEHFRLLTSDRRRIALDLLAADPTPIGIEPLAEAIAEHEASEAGRPDGEHVERVKISLHHNHLPKMADAGIVGYDCETRTVEPLLAGDEESMA